MATTTSFKFSTKSFDGITTSGSVGGLGGGTSLPQNVAYTNTDNSFSVSQTFTQDLFVGSPNSKSLAFLDRVITVKTDVVNYRAGLELSGNLNVDGLNTAIAFLHENSLENHKRQGQISLNRTTTDSGGTMRFAVSDTLGTLELVADLTDSSFDIYKDLTVVGSMTRGGNTVIDAGNISSYTAGNASQLGGVDAVNYMRLDDNAGTPRILDMNNSITFGLGGTPLKSLTGNTEINIIGKVESDGNVVSGGNVLASSGYFKSDAPTGNSGTLIDGGVASPTAENIKFGSVHGISTTTYGWSGRVIVMEVDGVSYSVMTADDDTPIT